MRVCVFVLMVLEHIDFYVIFLQIHSTAGVAVTAFLVVTCAKNNLAVANETLLLARPRLYAGVASCLVLSMHMVLYFFVPSVMLFLNKRQRAWVPVALVAVLVALDSAINLGSIDDCVQGGEDARCFPLLVSQTFGVVLAALSGTIVHFGACNV